MKTLNQNLIKKLEKRAGREIIIEDGMVYTHFRNQWLPNIELSRLTMAFVDNGLK